eukprot:510924-Pyramimonas_sp.AAC.1
MPLSWLYGACDYGNDDDDADDGGGYGDDNRERAPVYRVGLIVVVDGRSVDVALALACRAAAVLGRQEAA